MKTSFNIESVSTEIAKRSDSYFNKLCTHQNEEIRKRTTDLFIYLLLDLFTTSVKYLGNNKKQIKLLTIISSEATKLFRVGSVFNDFCKDPYSSSCSSESTGTIHLLQT